MPLHERLHIDELKRVERQTNALLKLWRRLNRDHALLSEKFTKLEAAYVDDQGAHAAQLGQLRAEHARALENGERQWQEKMQWLESQHAAAVSTLTREHDDKVQALEASHRETVGTLERQIAQLERQLGILVARVRGVGDE
ncbi:MAG: hypothetical protein Q4D61_06450 [Cardiobacteriaceae bacterium]|nr:hypothetical protein [Cardiobacteriaceae bacterium]